MLGSSLFFFRWWHKLVTWKNSTPNGAPRQNRDILVIYLLYVYPDPWEDDLIWGPQTTTCSDWNTPDLSKNKNEQKSGVPLGPKFWFWDDYEPYETMSFQACELLSASCQASRSVWIRKCDAELSGSSLPLVGVAHQQFVVSCFLFCFVVVRLAVLFLVVCFWCFCERWAGWCNYFGYAEWGAVERPTRMPADDYVVGSILFCRNSGCDAWAIRFWCQ